MFFGLGLVTAALGPFLPELAANTTSSLSQIGAVFTMLFLGALISQTIAGPLMDRIGPRLLLLAGLLLISTGFLGVSLSRSFTAALACALIGGMGHGAIDVGGNVTIAEAYSSRRVSALNLLNVFFGIGAVAGPAISSLTLSKWATAAPTLWVSVVVLALLIPFIYSSSAGHQAARTRTRPDKPLILRVPVLWVLGLLVLVYVGIENGLGGWTTVYIDRTTALGIDRAALVTSGFWLMLTIGRVFGVLLGVRMSSGRMLGASLGGSLLGGILLVAGVGNAPLSITAVLTLGLFFGPIFPTVLAITTAKFPAGPGQAASVVVVLGSTGGMLLPLLQGALLETSGPIYAAVFVAAGAAAMLLLFGLTRWFGRPVQKQDSTNARRSPAS